MKLFTCELESWSVVVLGDFNPGMFNPDWLEKFGLVSKEEAKNAIVRMITPELSSFRVGTLDVQAQIDRFQVESVDPTAMALVRDLVIGVFKVLDQTPLSHMGINRQQHFRMESAEAWHTVGHTLAPKEIWKEMKLETPGTLSVYIQGKRPGSPAVSFNTMVQPSKKIPNGVYFMTNEHFQVGPNQTTSNLLDFLVSDWEASHAFARELSEGVLTRCLEQQQTQS